MLVFFKLNYAFFILAPFPWEITIHDLVIIILS